MVDNIQQQFRSVKLNSWMEDFMRIVNNSNKDVGDICLDNLCIPGTHHSGIATLKGIRKFLNCYATCQDLPVLEQLKIGVRYLSFTICNDFTNEDELWQSHFFISNPFQDQIKQVRQFLNNSSRQIIIIFVKRDHDRSLNKNGVNKMFQLFETYFEGQILRNEHFKEDLKQWYKKQKLPGRILLSGMDNFHKQQDGFNKQNPFLCPQHICYSKSSWRWTNQSDPDEIIPKLQQFVLKNKPDNKKGDRPSFKIAESILTLDTKSVIRLGTIFNKSFKFKPKLYNLCSNQNFIKYSNIVFIDYVIAMDCWRIIQMNKHRFLL